MKSLTILSFLWKCYNLWWPPPGVCELCSLLAIFVGFILLQFSGDDSWISMGPFMQTKHLCVLIYYIIIDEVGTKPSSNFLTDHSKAVFLLWIFFFICFLCLSLPILDVFLLQPCGHLLGKSRPLCFIECDVVLCCCHFPIRCPGSGVVLDCINSWSLPSSLLLINDDIDWF